MSERGPKPTVRMSVRAVVETTLHESDLSPAAGAAKRMREGALAHKARQSAGQREEREYRAETALSAVYEGETLFLRVTGRADALLEREDGMTVVEEIKLGAEGAPLIPAHEAQAAMYAHMLCQRDALERVCLRVLYVDTKGKRLAQYEREAGARELAEGFAALCAPAAAWEAEKLARRQARDETLMRLAFPFDAYRAGQRKFAANVYIAIRERRRLFAQAPTGIGKTMAALYPALRALGEGKIARVVFLTARTTERRSAMDALSRLGDRGARLLAVEIAAKDKVCPQQTRDCRGERCPYARGFYDRLPAALLEAVRRAAQSGGMILGREELAEIARRHVLCPFELSLEAAKLSDVVVGDYNYVYDPFVSIDALLGVPGGAALLVDEAHQLAPRVRDALSAEISGEGLVGLRREIGRAHGRRSPLYRALTGAIGALEAAAQDPAFLEGRLDEPPEALGEAMGLVLEEASAQLASGGVQADADAFSLAVSFQLAHAKADERYALLSGGEGRRARLALLCLNAAPEILEQSKRAKGTVYFSATLAPFDAARRMLGRGEGDACLALPSPFHPEQLDARVAPIDIRYASRERTAPQVAEAIARQLGRHAGNALVFFPSYAYLGRIAERIERMEDGPEIALLREKRGMTEEEKAALLSAFEEEGERSALFAVLGGAFAEGIDLPGRKLQNVIVVSTGLPQPDERIRAMQAYYDAQGEDGFDLCMTLPGMVRVIQAAGRLIRTDEDTGSLLLIDSRFLRARERALLSGTLIGDALGLS